jgi:hypothetical protein
MQIVSSVLDTLLAASSGGVLTEPQGKLIHKNNCFLSRSRFSLPLSLEKNGYGLISATGKVSTGFNSAYLLWLTIPS